MNMKKLIIGLSATGLLVGAMALTVVAVEDKTAKAEKEENTQNEVKTDVGAAASLKAQYPNYSFDKVVETEIPGIFLVYGPQNVIYFFPKTGHLIFGDIWNKEGVNITEAPRKEVMATQEAARKKQEAARKKQFEAAMKDLPLDEAVVIGNGPKKVIEITDPDCPYCRRASEYFAKRDDVTRYVFFMPLDQIHPQAKFKVSYILGAKDPAKAYEEAMAGLLDKKQLPEELHAKLEKHRGIGQSLGVRGTPNFWVVDAGEMVSGANFPQLDQLLN